MKRALIDCAVAKEAKGDPIFVAIFRSERQSSGKRNVRPDNRVPAVHVILFVEKVHRAAKSLSAAGRLSEKFGHTRVGAGSARQGVAVIAISSNNVIVGTDGSDRADHNGFLADVEVAKAADLLRLILLARAFLETANQQHHREHLD